MTQKAANGSPTVVISRNAALAWAGLLLGATTSAAAADWQAVAVGPASLELKEGGHVWATITPQIPASRRGMPTLRSLSVAKRTVLEFRAPVQGVPQQTEVWLGLLGASDARPIWHGLVGPQDRDAESRLSLAVAETGIEEFQTAARLGNCDGQPIRLFSRRWDPTTPGFVPTPPSLPPVDGPVIQAHRGDPRAPSGRPVGTFHWVGASSNGPHARDARSLTAPLHLGDGNPNSVWTPGTPGDGAGEVLVARSGGGAQAVHGLRILVGDTSSAAAFATRLRPRRLSVLLGTGRSQDTTTRRFEVELVEDADGGAGRYLQPFWVALPEPVTASCVSLTIRQSAGTRTAQAERVTAVADIDIFTDVDQQGGLARLVHAIASGTACESRLPELLALHAYNAVALAIAGTAGTGRTCLLEALGHLLGGHERPDPLDEDAVGSAVVFAARNSNKSEERALSTIVAAMTRPPLRQLGELLRDERAADDDRVLAAHLLSVWGKTEAWQALVAAAGTSPAVVRTEVRQRLCAAKDPSARSVLRTAFDAAPSDPVPRRADLLMCLAAMAPPDDGDLRTLLLAGTAPANAFEIRARAVVALGGIGGPRRIADLATVRAQAEDSVLRYLAVQGLADAPEAEATTALRQAVADADPRVRETAALALGRRRDQTAGPLLIAGAKQEPWPAVRRAEIIALGQICGRAAGDLLVIANERDVTEVRRAALLGLGTCKDPRALSIFLRVLGRRNEVASLRELAARLLGQLQDRAAAPEMSGAVQRLLVESGPDLALEGVAVTAITALASIGGNEALDTALMVAADPRPSLQRGGITALGILCDGAAGRAVLLRAAQGNDPTLGNAAKAALQGCSARR